MDEFMEALVDALIEDGIVLPPEVNTPEKFVEWCKDYDEEDQT